MDIHITTEDYFHELDLIKNQNPREDDLYHLIYLILKSTNCMKELSIRDVHGRQRSDYGQIFYGLCSFPDFIITNKTFVQTDKVEDIDDILLCVEAKKIGHNLLNIKSVIEDIKKGNTNKFYSNKNGYSESAQLLGELLWYKKVLYTNGTEWQVLKWEPKKGMFETVLAVVNDRIHVESTPKENDSDDCDFLWYNKLDEYDREFFKNLDISVSEFTLEKEKKNGIESLINWIEEELNDEKN